MTTAEAGRLCSDLAKLSASVLDKWEKVGLKLGLSNDMLRSIGQKHKTSRQRFYAVLCAWLRRKGALQVTLRFLVQVLESSEISIHDRK